MIDRTTPPKIQEQDRLIIPVPECQRLPNGIPLYMLNSDENDVIRFDVVIGGGRWMQTQPLQALFTNRMLREGTVHFSAAEIAERLDYYGAWLELSSSAKYSFITLYSLSKYLRQTIELLASILQEPVFPEKELKTVIDNNLQQYWINCSKVDFLAHHGILKALYGTYHPNGMLAVESDYHNLTRSVLCEFYERFYTSSNITFYLAGKITPEVCRLVTEFLGTNPFGHECIKEIPSVFVPTSMHDKRLFIERTDSLQSAVRMGMLSISQKHPDYQKLRVLITLLGGYFGSRLMSNIREDKGYTYGINAGMIVYPENCALVIGAETANEHVEPLIKEVYYEIERLQSELVPEDELSMVRNYMIGEMCRSYESALSITDAWIFIQISEVGKDFFDQALDAIRSITPDEIRDLAGKYLCKENIKEVVSGKKMS